MHILRSKARTTSTWVVRRLVVVFLAVPSPLISLLVACSPIGPTSAPAATSSPIRGTAPSESSPIAPTSVPAATRRVPQNYPTIQAAIDAAQNGDVVLVAPGVYGESLVLSGKTITLASQFYTTGDTQVIDSTIIDGQAGLAVVTVDASVGPDTQIVGFTIRNAEDGIKAYGKLRILNNRITDTSDGIDFEDGGGLVRDNTLENNRDDGIDGDGATGVTIENNIIRGNGNDGIEIRLHEYDGVALALSIRSNAITGNGEDGIQLIDYPDVSHRVLDIQYNLIADNAQVGLGLMDNGETDEDVRAASIPERIHLFNNTFSGNLYAVTGGDNLIALNNVFVNSTVLGLKNVDAGSIAAYNLFWNNGADYQGSNVDLSTTLFGDPLLDAAYHLLPGSPAIDGGTAHFEWNGETVLDWPPGAYSGAAPDIGAYEFDPTAPTPALTSTSGPASTFTPATETATPPGSIRFAIIGDYGEAGQPEQDVANLVKSWHPDLIITTGDNNYPDGTAQTIDRNIGQYYYAFIYPYTGSYGPGATTNRFFPSLGNHDWHTPNAQPYLDYFTLPGNERYYDFVWGPVHFFAIDSDGQEPDGNSSTSTQAVWLQDRLAASTAPWQLVYVHYSPYSSGAVHGSASNLQWPYQMWGADAVLTGHDHTYERILQDGIPYFVNGLGGRSIYAFGTPVSGSQVRYNGDYGAMLVEASESQIVFQFIARTGAVIDTYTLAASPRE